MHAARRLAARSDASRRACRRHKHHWLSERWRAWLDASEHGWWRRGMLARLRKDHRLSGGGREEMLVADIERRAEALARAHGDLDWLPPTASSADKARDRSHLRAACRVLATHRALSPWIRDEDALLDIMRQHNGGEPLARTILETGVAAALALSRDRESLVVRMVRAMAHDHGDRGWSWRRTAGSIAHAPEDRFAIPSSGEATDSERTEPGPGPGPESENRDGGAAVPSANVTGEDRTDDPEVLFEMTTPRCLYVDLFRREGAETLATTTCCSVDGEAWFGGDGNDRRRRTVSVRRVQALSRGDDACVVRVERAKEGG